jgi:hypothetical protein
VIERVVAWCASWRSHRPRAGLRPWHVGRVVTDLLAERILRTREEAGPVDLQERADEVLAIPGAGEAAYEALAECVSDVVHDERNRGEPERGRATAAVLQRRWPSGVVSGAARSRWTRPVAASSGRRCAPAAMTTRSAASAPAGDRHRQPGNRLLSHFQ